MDYLRPLSIGLLVLMHSFTVYNGSWRPFEGYLDVEAYRWIVRFSGSFMLALFVFISGYILSFQYEKANGSIPFFPFVKKKVRRLLLPSVLFSIAYVFLISDSRAKGTAMVYSILAGAGHLWFLPMLFWCYIIGLFILRLRIPEWLKLAVLFVFSIIPWPGTIFIFRIAESFHYLFYFYLGVIIFRNRNRIMEWGGVKGLIVITLAVWIAVVWFLSPLRESLLSADASTSKRFLNIGLCQIIQLLRSLAGLMGAWLTVTIFVHRGQLNGSPFISWANRICFGVYLFQQFFLQAIYYKTTVPVIFGPYWLPWVGFIATLVLSILSSWLLMKTKVGRYIFG